MRKARHDQKDPYLAILDFRNTPTQGFNTSLAQRLMNRRTNTVINKTKFIATEHRFSISCAQRNATTETETTILIVCTIIKLFIKLSQNRNDGF